MIAILAASARGFLRDWPGLAMTLALPPVVYLLFAAIFGASARGEIDSAVMIHDAVRSAQTQQIQRGLADALGRRLTVAADLGALDQAVIDGRVDAGVLIRPGDAGRPRIEVLYGAGRDVSAAAAAGRVERLTAVAYGGPAARAPSLVQQRSIGPQGDVQAVYYAGAVSIMFVFFAAMHGAMSGLADRQSGLQARLALAAGGLGPILAGRAAWLTLVGVAQSVVVFALAFPRLPGLSPWQAAAWLATAALASAAAAGVAMAIIGLCRSRDQAQPLSTAVVLLLAALGGSMAPRFLMPEAFRQLGWITPHAWTIEAYQTVLWRAEMTSTVLWGWAFLAALAITGLAVSAVVESRRAPA